MSVRFALRDATRDAHDRLDALMGAHGLGDEAAYRRFLSAMAGALIPVEAALSAAGAARLVPDHDTEARTGALLRDLAALGLAVPAPEKAPEYATLAAVAGGLYVLEGSRLGAATLAPTVGANLPSAFLGQRQPPGRWQQIVATLERILQLDVDRTAAVGAALATFDCFERSARRYEAR